MLLATDVDPYAGPAFTVSIIALVISALGGLLSLINFFVGLSRDRKSGALVKVEKIAYTDGRDQHVGVTVRNTGRTAISVTAVLLEATSTSSGRKPADAGMALYMESGPGGTMQDVKPYRLEGHSSLELGETFKKNTPLWNRARYRVDVELATGRVIRSRWFRNQSVI